MSAIETEVKFRVQDVARVEQRLQAAGFRRETPRTFERNVLYDTPERRLRLDRQILRIRQYGDKWVLTHKAIPAEGDVGPTSSVSKPRLPIGDGETVAAIFASLGFTPAFTYEKWRTEWTDGTGHCVIDETPIGTFAELEGPEDWIDKTSTALAVDAGEMTNLSYGRMFELWKAETGSPANDLTFAAIGRLFSRTRILIRQGAAASEPLLEGAAGDSVAAPAFARASTCPGMMPRISVATTVSNSATRSEGRTLARGSCDMVSLGLE